MKIAPIAFFVYNRPDKTTKTLKSLLLNSLARKSIVYFFCDGPRNNEDLKNINKVRKIVLEIKGFKKKIIINRKKNFGLANNTINGINHVFRYYKNIIVLEDDDLTSPYFLNYMNDALNIYENDNKVASISGYSYPIKNKKKGNYFLRLGECWGWGTWRRSWKLFERDGNKLLNLIEKKNLVSEFNFYDSYNYFRQLKNFCLKKNSSWAIRWYASLFLANKLTYYPEKTLIQNIGMDGKGTHSENTNNYYSKFIDKYKKPKKLKIKESSYHLNKMILFFREINNKNKFIKKIRNKLFLLFNYFKIFK